MLWCVVYGVWCVVCGVCLYSLSFRSNLNLHLLAYCRSCQVTVSTFRRTTNTNTIKRVDLVLRDRQHHRTVEACRMAVACLHLCAQIFPPLRATTLISRILPVPVASSLIASSACARSALRISEEMLLMMHTDTFGVTTRYAMLRLIIVNCLLISSFIFCFYRRTALPTTRRILKRRKCHVSAASWGRTRPSTSLLSIS